MIDEIIKAIAIKLNRIFGDGYSIYTQPMEQGVKKPCFFIGVKETKTKPLLNNRFFLCIKIEIKYLSDKQLSKTKDIVNVCEKLAEEIEYVDYDGKIYRCKNIKTTVNKDIGTVDIEYMEVLVKQKDDDELMEILDEII